MKTKIYAAVLLAFSLSSCAAFSDESEEPEYTNSQAVSSMETMVDNHAKSQGAVAGPLKTVCNLEDTEQDDDTGTYKCTTYVKSASVVLYAECTESGCTPTGYDKVEETNE